MMVVPCHNCESRHKRCHSECEQYREYVADCEKKRQSRKINRWLNEADYERGKHKNGKSGLSKLVRRMYGDKDNGSR